MPDVDDDLSQNLEAVQRAAERDPDDADIAADDAGATVNAEEVGDAGAAAAP